MSKAECNIMHWFCTNCSKFALDTVKTIYNINVKQQELELELSQFKHIITVTKFNSLESELEKMKEIFSTKYDAVENELKKVKENVTSIETRNNVLIAKKIAESEEKSKSLVQPPWAEVVDKQVNSKFEQFTSQFSEVKEAIKETKP